MREPLHNRIEPNFDDVARPARRRRKPARAGVLSRFEGRTIADGLAVFGAVVAIAFIFVNALAFQRSPVRPAQAAPKPVAGPAAPAATPLPQPRPEGTRSRTELLRDVQQELASRGYYDGAVDGAPGPRIVQAIRDFESAQRLRSTGEPSETLLAQIRKTAARADITGSTGAAPAGNPRVLSAQRLLARFGYGPLRLTGVQDQGTSEAIARFEKDRNMPQTGEVSDRLQRELAAYGAGD